MTSAGTDLNPVSYDYKGFLKSEAAAQWRRLGTHRRAGVAVPLFSLRSEKSSGIGEIPDLKLMTDFCKKCGMSLLQLLPLNDVGWNFRPYDAESAFALEPMYLSLEKLHGVKLTLAEKSRVKNIRKRFSFRPDRGVDYGVKKAKISLLWDIYRRSVKRRREPSYSIFLKSSRFWLNDYALFKTLKERFGKKAWFAWPSGFRDRDLKVLTQFKEQNAERFEFYVWLQWQLFCQMREVKQYAASRGVFLMGDIPFLVSRDSAEVWAHQDYFRLDFASGAPPDHYAKKGQRWGMPPYDWKKMAKNAYDYWTCRLRYAENFYDLYRVDHAIGLFRIWSIPTHASLKDQGIPGRYIPWGADKQERQGRRLLKVFLAATSMLPCAEDLGTVPECSFRVLKEFGVPGTDIQRWLKRSNGKQYLPPARYRLNSVAMPSTHDMDTMAGWWRRELKSNNERMIFWRFLGGLGQAPASFSKELALMSITALSCSASILSVLMLPDWLSLERTFRPRPSRDRINVPTTTSSRNWTYVCPYLLEELKKLDVCQDIRDINQVTGRRQ
jgi:4-alpha-glucanotransferase